MTDESTHKGLSVENLVVQYPGVAEPTLKGISLRVERGRRTALVGESGSGKSTLAKALLGLAPIVSGGVRWRGERQQGFSADYRLKIQMVFQDPYNSLHPRLTVERNLMEPLKIHGLFEGESSRRKAGELLERVGLDSRAAGRYPHEFSGGQLQRIGIARALLTEPDMLLADEPVSALDVSVQAQVLNLLGELSQERGLGLLMISHDLGVVRRLCQEVAVMYKGRLVEVGSVEQVCFESRHPYTETLVKATLGEAVGVSDGLEVVAGDACPFAPRCSYAQPRCRQELPRLLENGEKHACACHFPLDERMASQDRNKSR